ncbi:hypothetical protein BN1723_014152 [Verticillium longisporum]|uniref:Splicing factor Cactin n=1 Tax=Verticillium longisporum TaxID=100787 RepID=A0A0G4M2V0_VERLO|nr:hypothetical protein BN1723_014152 [Verticillium longisporum]
MDPARKAMIQSGRRSPPRRDIASPRNDPNTRISKPTNPPPSARSRQNKTSPSAYMTQDEQARKFVAEEDKFVLKQTKKKADIRVREGRAKPIDLLAYNLRFVDDDRDLFDEDEADLHVALTAPDVVLQSLDESQLRELEADIKSYHTLETNSRNREYWLSLQTICSERRQKLEPQGPDDRVVSAVSSDVDKILSPKTYEQLEALEKQVKAKLQSNEDIDTDYWEQLLRSLLVWKAKAKLKKVYEAVKESRAAMLNARHPNKAHSSSDVVPGLGGASSLVRTSTGAESSSRFDIKAPVKSIIPSSAPPGTARFAQVENEDFSQATKALYERELIDKTKAPTFKIIREHGRKRGESFAPAGEEDTCLIRFIAGPPYEDIAFRIVDREWDYSAKKDRGFKSSFDKGILQLHFQFKKIYYRK